MEPGEAKTYIKEYRRALGAALDLLLNHDAADDEAKAIIRQIRAETGATPTLKPNKEFDDALRERLTAMTDEATVERMLHNATELGYRETEPRTYQAMEAFIHNLNTMHSRAGAQTPFSSINYGTDTTPEETCEIMIEQMQKLTIEGLTGTMTWSATGEVSKTPTAVKIENGVYVITNRRTVTPTPTAPIPETGQLWWPVPILAGAGMILVVIGWILHRKWSQEHEEP